MAVFKKHDVAADMHGITEGVIWKQMLLFFFPILLGTFFQQLYNTVDAMVVGKFVGKQALAAVGGATRHAGQSGCGLLCGPVLGRYGDHLPVFRCAGGKWR